MRKLLLVLPVLFVSMAMVGCNQVRPDPVNHRPSGHHTSKRLPTTKHRLASKSSSSCQRSHCGCGHKCHSAKPSKGKDKVGEKTINIDEETKKLEKL